VENKEEKNFRPASFSCDTGILGKLYLNHWKYWIFNMGIFTYFKKYRKRW